MSRSSYAGRSHFSGNSGFSGGAGMSIEGMSGAIIEEDETSAGGDRDSLYDGEERVIACQDLLESTDWSKTDLGPKSGWPGSLRTVSTSSSRRDSLTRPFRFLVSNSNKNADPPVRFFHAGHLYPDEDSQRGRHLVRSLPLLPSSPSFHPFSSRCDHHR